jgi:hypothetical protein
MFSVFGLFVDIEIDDIVLSDDFRVLEACFPHLRHKLTILQVSTMQCQGQVTRDLIGVQIRIYLPMDTTCHKCLRLKVLLLSHQGPTTKALLQRTIHQELDLCLIINHNTGIHSGIGMVVHIHAEMVLTIITMGTGVIRTAEIRTRMLIREISMVETIIGLQDLFHSL